MLIYTFLSTCGFVFVTCIVVSLSLPPFWSSSPSSSFFLPLPLFFSSSLFPSPLLWLSPLHPNVFLLIRSFSSFSVLRYLYFLPFLVSSPLFCVSLVRFILSPCSFSILSSPYLFSPSPPPPYSLLILLLLFLLLLRFFLLIPLTPLVAQFEF